MKICDHLGIHDSSLHRRLRLHGLSLRPKFQYTDWEKRLRRFSTIAEAAREFGMKPDTLRAAIRRSGFDHSFPVRSKGRGMLHGIDTETLHLLTRETSATKVAKKLGISQTGLRRELTKRGIDISHHLKRRALRHVTDEEMQAIYDEKRSKGYLVLGVCSRVYYEEMNRRGIKLKGQRNVK